jgi:hypothetical protein
MRSDVTVACVHAELVALDRERTLAEMEALASEAADAGAPARDLARHRGQRARPGAARHALQLAGILYARLDPAPLVAERQRFVSAGHYHRPDVLQLTMTPLAEWFRAQNSTDRHPAQPRLGEPVRLRMLGAGRHQ